VQLLGDCRTSLVLAVEADDEYFQRARFLRARNCTEVFVIVSVPGSRARTP
jgi:hypothetical protein